MQAHGAAACHVKGVLVCTAASHSKQVSPVALHHSGFRVLHASKAEQHYFSSPGRRHLPRSPLLQ